MGYYSRRTQFRALPYTLSVREVFHDFPRLVFSAYYCLTRAKKQSRITLPAASWQTGRAVLWQGARRQRNVSKPQGTSLKNLAGGHGHSSMKCHWYDASHSDLWK